MDRDTARCPHLRQEEVGGDQVLHRCESPRQPPSLINIATVRALCLTADHPTCPRYPREGEVWVQDRAVEVASRSQSIMVGGLLLLLLMLAVVTVIFARLSALPR
jgi:hypothetical protein